MTQNKEGKDENALLMEKLSRIKDINEKISIIDKKLEQLAHIEQVKNSMECVQIKSDSYCYDFPLPPEQIMKTRNQVKNFYTDTKSMLILEAQSLMK